MDKQPKLHFKHIMRIEKTITFLVGFIYSYTAIDLFIYIPLAYFNRMELLTIFCNSIVIAFIIIVALMLFKIKTHLAKLDIANMKSLDLDIQDILKVMERQAEENNEEKENKENE